MSDNLVLEKLQQIHGDMTNGFQEVFVRIGALEERVLKLEIRMEKLEVRVESLELRMEKLESRMENMESRMESIESQVQKLFQLYASHHSELEAFHYYMARHDEEIFANEEKIVPLIPLPKKVHTLEKTVAFHGRVLKKAF